MPKYLSQKTAKLDSDLYFQIFEERGVKYLQIHRPPRLQNTIDISVPIRTIHIWKYGDKLHRIASAYYGDMSKFWIIGLINQKPTDAHYSIGDQVIIPADISRIENAIGDSNGLRH